MISHNVPPKCQFICLFFYWLIYLFPTCQVRVVRFYVSHFSSLPMAAFPTGPQPRAPNGSVPHRTSTCQNLCQECQNLSQIECQHLCQIECQNLMSDRMSDRMSQFISDRMSESMPDRMSEFMPEDRMSKICQIECQNMSWIVMVGFSRSEVIYFLVIYSCFLFIQFLFIYYNNKQVVLICDRSKEILNVNLGCHRSGRNRPETVLKECVLDEGANKHSNGHQWSILLQSTSWLSQMFRK